MSSSSEDRIEPGWEKLDNMFESMVADIERKAALITTLNAERVQLKAELKAARFTVLKAQRDELKAACDEFQRRVQELRVVDRALV